MQKVAVNTNKWGKVITVTMLPIKLPSTWKVTIKDKPADSEDILKYSTYPRLHCLIYNIPQSHEDIPTLKQLVGSTDQTYVKLDIHLKNKKGKKCFILSYRPNNLLQQSTLQKGLPKKLQNLNTHET